MIYDEWRFIQERWLHKNGFQSIFHKIDQTMHVCRKAMFTYVGLDMIYYQAHARVYVHEHCYNNESIHVRNYV